MSHSLSSRECTSIGLTGISSHTASVEAMGLTETSSYTASVVAKHNLMCASDLRQMRGVEKDTLQDMGSSPEILYIDSGSTALTRQGGTAPRGGAAGQISPGATCVAKGQVRVCRLPFCAASPKTGLCKAHSWQSVTPQAPHTCSLQPLCTQAVD